MNRLAFTLFLFLVWTPSGQARTLWDRCQVLMPQFMPAYFKPVRPIQLNAYLLRELKEWSGRNCYAKSSDDLFHPDLKTAVILRLGELPIGVRKEIFSNNGSTLSYTQFVNRLTAIGIDVNRNYVLRVALSEAFGNSATGETPLTAIEAKIYMTQELVDGADHKRLSELLEDKILKNDVMAFLSDEKTREYRIRVSNDQIQLPDGRIYRLLKRNWNGDLVIQIPSDKIIGDSNSDHLKDRNYDSSRIDGIFLPDGRFYTTDLNSWARARVFAKNNLNTVTVRPSDDGHFYSRTHSEVMGEFSPRWFSMYWATLSPDAKKNLRMRAEVSPYEVMDEIYFQWSSRLSPFD